jgi:hypothetical protein
MVAFVPSNADELSDAAKNAAISGVEGHAITAVAARTLPIPIVGGFIAEQLVGRIMNLHHPAVKGFNIAFLQGLSARTVLQSGYFSFTVPAQSLQGQTPVLLRLKPSFKDSARIVRGVHIITKMTGSTINPTSAKILGVDQDAIYCSRDSRNGDLVLTTNSALASGEYAIVLIPTEQDIVPVGQVWDFRVP